MSIKSRRIKYVGYKHIARTGEIRNEYTILIENLRGRVHLEYLGVDGKLILKWILKK
jgi:hypothetical protein